MNSDTLLASIRESLRLGFNALNPFYRNPIMAYTDFQHIQGDRRVLANPNLAVKQLMAIFKQNQSVRDALRELQGDYVLKTAVFDHQLHVNVHYVSVGPEEFDGAHPLDPQDWQTSGMYYFSVGIWFHDSGTIRPLIRKAPNCYYDPFTPAQSWTIDLSPMEIDSLGLKCF